ncbi:MAG: carbamoyltransferase HypF, partial [bacterium]
ERIGGQDVNWETPAQLDVIEAAAQLLQKGAILAIQGIGGFHLACDATNTEVVQQLRQRKVREAKPFALMGKNREMLEKWCFVNQTEWNELSSPVAPIVLLHKHSKATIPLPEVIAPDQHRLGWMLPYTPLHHLLFKQLEIPLVFTSGNLSDEPQCKTREEAQQRLKGIADWLLWNERPIVNRVDDSIIRVEGNTVRVLRRARGLAPEPLPLPEGFEDAPSVWAFGASLKNTFCRIIEGHALLSPHIGDLQEARAITDFENSLKLFEQLYPQPTTHVAVDLHVDYPCTRIGEEFAQQHQLPIVHLQHHHAHMAACLVEHMVPLTTTPVLGIVLDGLGMGLNGELWGGEILLGDYRSVERLGLLKPVALLGGNRAMREPWRNTLAQLLSSLEWDHFLKNYGQLELAEFLKKQPVSTYQNMLQLQRNAPLASSTGRLFDAVAGALGLCRESVAFEGQAAMQLQGLAETALESDTDEVGYPFKIDEWPRNGLPSLNPFPMWPALLDDLKMDTSIAVIALRFHRGLAQGLVKIVQHLQTIRKDCSSVKQVVLSGGVFQNELLAQLLETQLREQGLSVLRPAKIPCNDGGISLGQAAIAAAQILRP